MSNSVFHTLRELVRVLDVFSVLNVGEFIRDLTCSRSLKKQCMYRYSRTSFSRLHVWFIRISFPIFFSKFKFPNAGGYGSQFVTSLQVIPVKVVSVDCICVLSQSRGKFLLLGKSKTASSPPIFSLFPKFFLEIRDHTSTSTLTLKSKFEENCWT